MDYSSSSDDEASLFLLEQRMRISQASHNLMRQTIMVLDTLHPQHGGLSSGRRYIDQDREADHLQLMKDYFFDTNSTYNEDLFRRFYRMRRSLFTKSLNDVTNFDTYFMRRKNATGKWGASPHQKMTLVMRMLTYGILVDAADEYSRYEYSRLGKSTIIESFQHFIRAIPQIYGATYLRSPTKDDLTRLLCKASQKGFPDDERPDDPIDESDDESDHEDRFRRAVSCYDGVEETPSSQSVLTLEERSYDTSNAPL
ncbi:hypothetical protein Q3G72_026942 [Acer saccharum]|nr:hypothetical protein Q3G72_026942 [Acer saccharum]